MFQRSQLKSLALDFLPPVVLRQLKKLRSATFLESDQNIRSDEYIAWLCVVVGGWLTPQHGNLRAFDYAIRHMPAQGAVIEIGSFLGLSTNIIAYLMAKYQRDTPFFGCDPWVFEETEQRIGGYFDAGSKAYANYCRDIFKQNLNIFSPKNKPFVIESFSNDFFNQWHSQAKTQDVFGRAVTLGGSISFAYIDGAHTYEDTKSDFLGVHQHLLVGGFILFDDSAVGSGFGSTQAALEVAQNPAYELVFKTPHFFFKRIN